MELKIGHYGNYIKINRVLFKSGAGEGHIRPVGSNGVKLRGFIWGQGRRKHATYNRTKDV